MGRKYLVHYKVQDKRNIWIVRQAKGINKYDEIDHSASFQTWQKVMEYNLYLFIYFYVYVYVPTCVYVYHMPANACGLRKGYWIPRFWNYSQLVVSHLMWFLGTEPVPFATAAIALIHLFTTTTSLTWEVSIWICFKGE